MKRGLALLAALLALMAVSAARADGEAGLVIQEGDTATTYCIPFSGDSITGDGLLAAAGRSVEQFGPGSGRTLCAIDGTGCADASSFDSCFCQCRSGSDSCTYWAFFTQRYGSNWVYSSSSFTFTRARDGDIQGWKWGAGGPSSAAPPVSISFEQICGHAPRGAVGAATATPTGPPPTEPPSEPSQTEPAAGPAKTVTATSRPSATAADSTETAGPSSVASAAPSPGHSPAAPTVVITAGSTERATPRVPATGSPDSGGGFDAGAVAAFAGVAVALSAAIGAAVIWRRRHGT